MNKQMKQEDYLDQAALKLASLSFKFKDNADVDGRRNDTTLYPS